MIRILIDLALVFLIPFAAYAAYQAYAQKDPRAAFRMTQGPFVRLTIIGLAMCIGSIVLTELLRPPHAGGYDRAVWKDGKLIEGKAK